jgi:hypothetical protein
MSTTDTELTRAVRSWIRAPEPASAERIVDAVLSEIEITAQLTPRRSERWLAFGGSPIPIGLALAAVVIVGLVAVSQLRWSTIPGGPPGSTEPPPSSVASPEMDPTGIVGLPPDGAPPSDTTPGELVLQWDGSITASGSMWVYADGRMLWWRWPAPEERPDPFIGLFERSLSSDGVEFLRSEVISTGLFEEDLVLAREGNAPYLVIRVRTGDQLVGVTWGWRGITGDAPLATREQEDALVALNGLLTSPETWPASSWEDEGPEAYTPATYAICFRSFELPGMTAPDQPIEARDVWAVLPQGAARRLLDGDPAPEGVVERPSCSRVSTSDARAIARLLDDAGIERATPRPGEFWLRYLLRDQGDLGDLVWINFEPVLPHGESTWLGPG